ncbi:hypothetical protein QYF36_004885 [Acer negundo]|nr:hypothetical protein QYF36_004885 [Acer negundo]
MQLVLNSDWLQKNCSKNTVEWNTPDLNLQSSILYIDMGVRDFTAKNLNSHPMGWSAEECEKLVLLLKHMEIHIVRFFRAALKI